MEIGSGISKITDSQMQWSRFWPTMNIFNLGVRCFYLARSANLPEWLYILPSVSFFFYIIFFNDFLETNYLKIHRTDFRNLYIEWKHFGHRWSIWTSFFDISRDVAMATDFVQKLPTPPALMALAFRNVMGYRLADKRINSSTNCSTSCKKWWKSVQ